MTTTTNPTLLQKAIEKFPQAKSVVLVDDVRALNKEQNIQTAAAYSFYKDGAMVVEQCCKSFVAAGYGSADDFYTMLCDMRDGKLPVEAAVEAAPAASEEQSDEVNTELFDLDHFRTYCQLLKYPARNADKIQAIEQDYPEYCSLTIGQVSDLLKAAKAQQA